MRTEVDSVHESNKVCMLVSSRLGWVHVQKVPNELVWNHMIWTYCSFPHPYSWSIQIHVILLISFGRTVIVVTYPSVGMLCSILKFLSCGKIKGTIWLPNTCWERSKRIVNQNDHQQIVVCDTQVLYWMHSTNTVRGSIYSPVAEKDWFHFTQPLLAAINFPDLSLKVTLFRHSHLHQTKKTLSSHFSLHN